MVSKKEVEKQLKRLGFKTYGWGRGEVGELPNIILPGEEIYEVVNGIYEGGFALLLASDVRVLLVDKKPLNYLTIEDVRFEQINEIDYYHRLLGAHITITSGSKSLSFLSYNQPRLRKLIGHVQHFMAEIKKQESTHQEGQQYHLEKINEQLQEYLVAQHQQQREMYEQLQKFQASNAGTLPPPPAPIEPSKELADYLYAQGLLAQYQKQNQKQTKDTGQNEVPAQQQPVSPQAFQPVTSKPSQATVPAANPTDLYAEGMQEIFGRRDRQVAQTKNSGSAPKKPAERSPGGSFLPLEINPLRIAYSKLPLALRNRKFGRPSFHAHNGAKRETEPAVSS